jgi:hypothetical protein
VNEGLLSLAWEKKYYDVQNLSTIDGRPLNILSPGTRNIHQGPDFFHTHVVIDGIHWVGTVEIHVDGADWYRHRHDKDEHYNSVVLHVVYRPSIPPPVRADGAYVPEFHLRPAFGEEFMACYHEITNGQRDIPCVFDDNIAHIGENVAASWMEVMAEERFEAKSRACESLLQVADGDWEQAAWIALSGAFAGPANKEAFIVVARAVHRKYLARSVDDKHAVIAMLLGASGMLPAQAHSPYLKSLIEHWTHYARKFEVKSPPVSFSHLRMRPHAFPTVRWVQLAALWEKAYGNGRSLLDYCRMPRLLYEDCARLVFDDYWKNRVKIGEPGKSGVTLPGKDFLSTILTNALYPMARLYAVEQQKEEILEDWVRLFRSLPPENNVVTRPYAESGFPNQHPLHSQGIIHLKREYCLQKRCMECEIGRTILSQ